MKEKPFVHLFRTPGNHYIYDVNTNMILKTDGTTYNQLSEMLKNPSQTLNELSTANDKIRKMVERGFLSAKRIEEVVHSADETLDYALNNKMNMVTLQVTQQCNLKCNYCPYSGTYENRSHSNQKMDFEVARKAIDLLIEHSKDTPVINVGFYGGEPLLEFPLIKKCVEYAKVKGEGKRLRFNFTSNGTVLTEEIMDFLVENNFDAMFSLDGPKEIHDENRKFATSGKGSYDKIMENIELFQKRYPEYVKTNVSFNAVVDPRLDVTCATEFFVDYETIKDLKVRFSTMSTAYAKDQLKPNEDFMNGWNYELFKVFLSKFGRVDEEHISAIHDEYVSNLQRKYEDQRVVSKSLPKQAHHSGPCVPGVQRAFVDIHGNLYPCERVSEISDVMRIGHVDTGFDREKVHNLLNIGQLSEEKCKNCWAFRFCYLCAAAADDFETLSGEKKVTACGRVHFTVESELKDYCLLKEFGYDFSMASA